MPPFVIHGSRGYQYRAKNNWKEYWLSLEQNGSLNWKRKDAFLPLATVQLSEVLNKIKIGDPWHEKPGKNGTGVTKPFFLLIPMRPNRPANKFAFLHGADLELWLAAFANALNAKTLYRTIKNDHTAQIAAKNGIAEEAVEQLLSYKDLVAFYKTIWQEFMEGRTGKLASHTAFIEERVLDVITNHDRPQLRKRTTDDILLPPVDDSTKNDWHVSSPPKENGHLGDHSIKPNKEAVAHTPKENGYHANGHAKVENGLLTKASVEPLSKGPQIQNGSHDLITPVGKARLEFYGSEEIKKSVYIEGSDKHVTVIHIDHYTHECNGADSCTMRF